MEPYDDQSNIQEKIEKVRQLLKGEMSSYFCNMQCLLFAYLIEQWFLFVALFIFLTHYKW